MNPKKVKGRNCDSCGIVTEIDYDPPEKITVWFIDTSDEFIYKEDSSGEGAWLLTNPRDLSKSTLWQCPSCGELYNDEGFPKVDAYQCGECEEVHEDRDAAKACCR